MARLISVCSFVALMACTLASAVRAQGTLESMVAAAKAEGSLMVYHTSPMPIIGSTFRAFEKKYGIKVQNYHATGNPLTVRFSSEAAVGRIIADVFYASDTTTSASFPEW
jgi:maltose-binding protein MalE